MAGIDCVVVAPRREGGGKSFKSSVGIDCVLVADRREGGAKSKSFGVASNPVNVAMARREFAAESVSFTGVSSPVQVVVARRETGDASTSRPRSETGPASMASRVNVEIPKSTSLTEGEPSAFSKTMTLPGFKSR